MRPSNWVMGNLRYYFTLASLTGLEQNGKILDAGVSVLERLTKCQPVLNPGILCVLCDLRGLKAYRVFIMTLYFLEVLWVINSLRGEEQGQSHQEELGCSLANLK
jgi:hypothetical protein